METIVLHKALPFLDKFVVWATPKRLALLSLLALVLITSVTLLEKRSALTILFSGNDAPPITVSRISVPESISVKIQALVQREPQIKFVMVTGANVRINQRERLYLYSNEPLVSSMLEQIGREQGSTVNLFGSNEGENSQIVSLINGEFRCDAIANTILSQQLPELGNVVPNICRVSLPPYYGEFSGYITFGLGAEITPALIERVRLEGMRLSTELYFKNFRSSQYEGRR